MPLLGYSSETNLDIGGEVLGFDAIDRHRYLLGVTYNTAIQAPDIFALYSNRSWGPTLNISADFLTNGIIPVANLTYYRRQADLAATVTFPIPGTYSSLIPSLSFNLQRAFAYQLDKNTQNTQLLALTSFYASVDGMLSYSNQETSPLSVTSESGRFSQIGARLYLLPEGQVLKGLLVDREFIKLAHHTILSPSLKASMVSSTTETVSSANSILIGRLPQLANAFPASGLNYLSIRGYPGQPFGAKTALVAALDLTFPLARIFRGWGTNQIFLENLYGFTFIEGSYLSNLNEGLFLPSFGGGVKLSTEALTIPLVFSLEYDQGLNSNFKGTQDLFFQISGSVPF